MELTAEQLLQSIWMALRRIEDNLSLPPAPLELPPINLPAPDLTDVVNAVTGLRPSATADDIARALADVLSPRTDDGAGDALRQVAEGLKTLDHRLQGFGKQAYGGGAVTLQSGQAVAISGTAITREASLTSKGYEQLTPTVSTALSPPAGSIYALLQARTADVHYRDDGVAPTSATGMRIILDNTLWYTGDLAALRFISVLGKLDAAYYGI